MDVQNVCLVLTFEHAEDTEHRRRSSLRFLHSPWHLRETSP
jgi:hypothetical protein